ncbi:hypothetical protein, partial [Mycobacterium kiyosense]|uniref:hypothetical protein n=1 Tax=Mycobacterium kiyosense TaxID=2871094 RepID=UPI0022319687
MRLYFLHAQSGFSKHLMPQSDTRTGLAGCQVNSRSRPGDWHVVNPPEFHAPSGFCEPPGW